MVVVWVVFELLYGVDTWRVEDFFKRLQERWDDVLLLSVVKVHPAKIGEVEGLEAGLFELETRVWGLVLCWFLIEGFFEPFCVDVVLFSVRLGGRGFRSEKPRLFVVLEVDFEGTKEWLKIDH